MIKPAIIFGSHMVLQQEKEIKIWGTVSPGQMIDGILEWESDKAPARYTAITDTEGCWQLCFPPQPTSFGVKLTIKSRGEALVWEDILIGEVWLAGGQSNMEYPLELDAEKETVLRGKMYSEIRFFDVPEISYPEEYQDCVPEASLWESLAVTGAGRPAAAGWIRSCWPRGRERSGYKNMKQGLWRTWIGRGSGFCFA